ncbi:MAG: tautomerase family protein [Janthinobacterium lividum]
MPFVSIRLSGTATKAQKADIVADVTRSLVDRLGKNPAAVQIVIEEVSTENYGAGGQLIADRDAGPAPAPKAPPAGQEPELALGGEDAHAEPSQ